MGGRPARRPRPPIILAMNRTNVLLVILTLSLKLVLPPLIEREDGERGDAQDADDCDDAYCHLLSFPLDNLIIKASF